ncbi:MAG TPA: class A beta-lactamase-related serine hydrolase [Crocinitomicaceae bacterium]|nr:class A beta-lactamase-related serine hydrolase [Crocinitomicaceae bacterium]
MKLLRKLLKFIGIGLIVIIISINLFILLSGRFYIYKGIANTYFRGEISPTIYDLDVFPYATLPASSNVSKLNFHSNFNAYELSVEEKDFIDDYHTKAILVFRNDTLLFEKYWENHSAEKVSNSFSMAKTVVAILVGAALNEGKIKSLDDAVCDYLPEFCSKNKETISIRDLLTMSSGLDWTESAKNPLSDNAESYYGEHLYELVTKQSLITEPGKVFNYQSGNSQLLGFIVEKATGKDLTQYAQEKIWEKIGAESDAFWSLDTENGDEKSFCCMYANTKDYGRLGLLLLNKGVFNDQRVISESYYNEMMKPAVLMTEEAIPNYRYGLHTWLFMDENSQVNYFRGVKGQYIITIPDEDLVIVRIGSKKKRNFNFDKNKLDDPIYLEENKFRVGHSQDFFQYLEMGRKIAHQIESK